VNPPPAEEPGTAALLERRMIIPVQGISARELRDDFSEMRGGHRHEAIDIMAARGTPVLAADEGKVVKLFLSKPGGLTVYQFDPTETYCYYYAHLDRYASGLREGMLLHKGDVLAYVGSTGDASPTAPHLHFAIFKLGPEKHWWQGTPINPYGFLTVSSSK
jgi:murein DD-endopeptidase MepM/ murein hydrolase activator NlpD